MEYSGANLKIKPQAEKMTKAYNFLGLTRVIIVLASIYAFPKKGLIQALIFFVYNLAYLMLTIYISDKLVYKGLILVREYTFLFWSIFIMVNASDDLNPMWDIMSFWIISWISLALKTLIMIIEMIIFLDVIKIAI